MTQQPNRLTIRRPDDWHLHLRDGHVLDAVIGFSARHFARAIVMPNLNPPVTTVKQAVAYRERILKAAGATRFQPLRIAGTARRPLRASRSPERSAFRSKGGLM